MAVEKIWPCNSHDVFVTINEYNCGVIEGYMIHPRLSAPYQLKSISHLIRLIDQVQGLDNIPYKPVNYIGTVFDNPNRVASFTITVLFQQHHSMQGKLIWHESGTEMVFRSAMELIYLMDDILAVQSIEVEDAANDR